MRLSEIKGEAALDVLADILPPIASIASDEDADAVFRQVPVTSKESKKKEVLRYWARHVPGLVRRHRADLVDILATLAGQTAKEYAATLTPISLVKDVYELLTDPVVLDLFGSAQTSGGGDTSGSAPENTGAAVQEG